MKHAAEQCNQTYPPIATRIPGTDVGVISNDGERLLDNARIEGNLGEQLRGAVAFARRNMRAKTVISPPLVNERTKPNARSRRFANWCSMPSPTGITAFTRGECRFSCKCSKTGWQSPIPGTVWAVDGQPARKSPTGYAQSGHRQRHGGSGPDREPVLRHTDDATTDGRSRPAGSPVRER